MIQDNGKNIDALKQAQSLKDIFGNGISALCLVYNATGGRLDLVEEKNWFGSTYRQNPPSYFENGQWIAFLHVRPNVFRGCSGARVFRSTTASGVQDIMVSWSIPLATGYINTVWTQIGSRGYFSSRWDSIYRALNNSSGMMSNGNVNNNLRSRVGIGGSSTAECIAILTHPFNPLPNEY